MSRLHLCAKDRNSAQYIGFLALKWTHSKNWNWL